MTVMINGAFGVGKTTVARLLRDSLPGGMIYDPEWAGSVLMCLPEWVKLKWAGSDDFQDIVVWWRSVVTGTRLLRLFASGPVIVPMTFTRYAYL